MLKAHKEKSNEKIKRTVFELVTFCYRKGLRINAGLFSEWLGVACPQ